MAKINPRLLLQIPLLLLGSCTPVVPSTSITIYTNTGGYPEHSIESAHVETKQVLSAPVHAQKPSVNKTAIRDCVTAIEKAEEDPNEIGLPDLSKIDGKTRDELNKAVVDLLIAHIKLQRAEITRLHTERKCFIGEIRAKRS